LSLPPEYGGEAGAGAVVDLGGQGQDAPRTPGAPGGPCPADMVLVSGDFCIDRYEVSLVDRALGRVLSPHYPPDRAATLRLFETWQRDAPRSRMSLGRSLPIPSPPEFQLQQDFIPRAVSEMGVLPAGYLSRTSAERACQEAGKRLCARGEWVVACRGQEDRAFPYGSDYKKDACNVHRQSHPARLLHGNSSEYHTDPRLGLTEDLEGPLLRRTGQTEACVSRWGADGLYDMVGNLDEWIDDPEGTFVGGFYSRATKDGCNSMIDVHAPAYFDYSLGARCCLDPG
jgi:sulfatase modifying factor 1